MNSLKSKIIVITGGSSGLGREVAIKAVDQGAKVIIIADRKEKLESVQKEILDKGCDCEAYVCDISDVNQVKTTVEMVVSKNPKIDILINNAAIWTDNKLEENNKSRISRAFEVNIAGHIHFTNEMLQHFEKFNAGHIFNVISSAANITADNTLWQCYGATKWALNGFTLSLRKKLAVTKIKVSGFYPGGFESDLYESAGRTDAHNQSWMMRTEDVADVVIFILSRPDDVVIESLDVRKF